MTTYITYRKNIKTDILRISILGISHIREFCTILGSYQVFVGNCYYLTINTRFTRVLREF